MKVWRLVSDVKSSSIDLVNYKSSRLPDFKGKIENWETVDFVTDRDGEYKDLPKFLPGVLVFSKKSFSLLDEYLKPFVQYLPINHPEGLLLVNVTNVLDCVDHMRSKFERMPSGRVVGIKQLFFHESILQDELIFKINENAGVDIYVTDRFRNIILKSDLKGFNFYEVWDSDVTIEIEQERQLRYQNKLNEIEQDSGKKMSWSKACDLVYDGKAVASGKWKLQKSKNGTIMLGKLLEDLSYLWISPIYYPPIILDLEWHEVSSSDI